LFGDVWHRRYCMVWFSVSWWMARFLPATTAPRETRARLRPAAAVSLSASSSTTYSPTGRRCSIRAIWSICRWRKRKFLFDLRAILMGPIEIALIAGHFHDPHPKATGATNASGNHDPSASIGGADLRE
jgi:hypothetical protein